MIVSDPPAKTLYAFDPAAQTLTPISLYGDIILSPPALDGGIAISPGSFLWVADHGTHSIRYALPPPRYMFSAAQVDSPSAITADDRGNFFITDVTTIRRLVYSSAIFDFVTTTLAPRFNDLVGIALDGSGNLFVCERSDHAILKIDPNGNVATIAALFDRPFGITTDPWGNLYVTERSRRMDASRLSPMDSSSRRSSPPRRTARCGSRTAGADVCFMPFRARANGAAPHGIDSQLTFNQRNEKARHPGSE